MEAGRDYPLTRFVLGLLIAGILLALFMLVFMLMGAH